MEASVNRFMAGEVSEVRINITKQTPEEPAIADRQAQLLFKFKHTMPATDEYQ